MALYVGVKRYEAEGGAVTRDLFAEEGQAGYIGNAELLYRLAKEKLEGEAAGIAKEGWKWVETRTSFDYSERHFFAEAPMGMRDATPKAQEKLDALAKEQADAEEALEALYEGGDDDFDQKAADALERQAEKTSRGSVAIARWDRALVRGRGLSESQRVELVCGRPDSVLHHLHKRGHLSATTTVSAGPLDHV